MSRVIWGLLLLAISCEAKKSYEGYKVISIQVEDEIEVEQLRLLERQGLHDFWTEVIPGRWTDVMTSPEMEADLLDWISQQGFNARIKIENVQPLIDRQLESNGTSEFAAHPMDWTSYHSLEDIYAYFDYLESSYDFISTESIGQSHEGQEMILLKVCRGGCGNKPAMWLDSGIHAREWISVATLTWLLREVVENDGKHARFTQQLDWYFLAGHNPDGYRYSMTEERMWRKTRTQYEGDYCYGTDANRNFDFHWSEPGASYDSCSESYYGPQAFSEVEARNVRDFIQQHKDTIKFFNTLHSYGQLILMPWGYTDILTPDYDRMFDLATRGNDALYAVHGEFYLAGCVPCVLYVASGISMDWVYGVAKIPYVYSIELRDAFGDYGFLLPPEQIIPTSEETWAFHEVVADQIIKEFA